MSKKTDIPEPEVRYDRGPILTAPTLTGVDYDGTRVKTDWKGPPDPGEVTSYRLTLYEDGEEKQTATIRGLTISFTPQEPFDKDKTYTVAVAPTGDKTSGPKSGMQTLIIVAPSDAALSWNGAHLVARWSAMQPAAGTSRFEYIPGLFRDGSPQETGNPTTGLAYEFESAFGSGFIYTSMVRAVRGIVTGPWSGPATGPFAEDVTYGFDSLGRIMSFAVANYHTRTYRPDVFGNITSVTTTAVSASGDEKGNKRQLIDVFNGGAPE